MNMNKVVRTVTVNNPNGLHARPAERLAKLANQFDADVAWIKDGYRVDGKSVLLVLTMGAEQGTRLELEVVGEDAEGALDALTRLVESNFEEDSTTDHAQPKQ